MLAGDRIGLWDRRGLLCGTDAEDGRLPLVALGREVLVLGGLAGHGVGQLDVWEHRVVVRVRRVDLLVADCRLRLSLGLRDALLRRRHVALVDVLHVFRVGVCGRVGRGLLSFLVDLPQDAVELVYIVLDLLLNCLLDARSQGSQQERLRDGKQKLVARRLHLDVEVLDVNVDLGDLEEVLTVALVSGFGSDLEREARAAQENITDTLILDRWEALLAIYVEGDISEIHLNARNSQHHLVLVLARDLLSSPSPVVVGTEFKHIWREIVTFNNQVLNNNIEFGIAVFNPRNWDVVNIDQESRDDDLSKILDEMRFECWLAILIVAEIEEEPLHGLTKGLVLWISIELVTQKLELVKDAVSVAAIFLTKEIVAMVVERIPLFGRSILHDESLLLKALANVSIDLLEPFLEFWILVGIAVNLIDSIKEIVKRGGIGKALDEGLQISLCIFYGVVTAEVRDGTLALGGESSGMTAVCLRKGEQCLDCLLIWGVSVSI